MLGPARFNHIETCAREACRSFRLRDEIEELVTALRSLDDILATLRAELATLKPSQPASEDHKAGDKKAFDYDALTTALDTEKAKRLITAREKAIKTVKLNIQKLQPKGSDVIKTASPS